MIRRLLLKILLKILGGTSNMIKLWATLIINGAMTLSEVPAKSQSKVHDCLKQMGFNDDGTPITETTVTQ